MKVPVRAMKRAARDLRDAENSGSESEKPPPSPEVPPEARKAIRMLEIIDAEKRKLDERDQRRAKGKFSEFQKKLTAPEKAKKDDPGRALHSRSRPSLAKSPTNPGSIPLTRSDPKEEILHHQPNLKTAPHLPSSRKAGACATDRSVRKGPKS
jgi:hypothetical protein